MTAELTIQPSSLMAQYRTCTSSRYPPGGLEGSQDNSHHTEIPFPCRQSSACIQRALPKKLRSWYRDCRAPSIDPPRKECQQRTSAP